MGTQPPNYPPPGGYPPGGFPPPGGKTQTLNLDYNIAGLLCYIPCCINLIASILFLVTEPKDSKFVRFHALQGLLLIGLGIVVGIVFWILQTVILVGSSGMGSAGSAGGGILSLLVMLVQFVIGIGLLVLHIMGCVKAYQNQMWQMPIIGGIAAKNA